MVLYDVMLENGGYEVAWRDVEASLYGYDVFALGDDEITEDHVYCNAFHDSDEQDGHDFDDCGSHDEVSQCGVRGLLFCVGERLEGEPCGMVLHDGDMLEVEPYGMMLHDGESLVEGVYDMSRHGGGMLSPGDELVVHGCGVLFLSDEVV